MECSNSGSKREVYSDKMPILGSKEISQINKNLTLHLKELEEETKPKVSSKKENTNIRAEIN